MKRFLSVAAVIIAVISLCFAFASCGSAKTDDKGFTYELDKESDTYILTGYSGSETDIKIPAKYDSKLVTSIKASAFAENKKITSVTIHKDVAKIGAMAFANCPELKAVTFEDGSKLTEIPTGAFSGCSNLDEIVIPNGVTTIGYKAFKNCTAMKTVTFPDKIETVDYYAFSGCTSLDTVNNFESKTFTVYANAFYKCDELTTLMTPEVSEEEAKTAVYTYREGTLSAKVAGGMELIKWLKPATVDANGVGSVTVAADIVDIHPQAFTDRYDIAEFKIAEGNKNYTVEKGILYSKDKKILVAYPLGLKGAEVSVAEGVKKIGDYAFEGNYNVETLKLPTSIETIGEAAFKNGSLKNIVFADNDEIKVKKNAFVDCKSFETFVNVKTNKNLEYIIREYVLYCVTEDMVKLISFPNVHPEGLKEFTVDETVTTISYGAFRSNEALESIKVDEKNLNFVAKDGVLYRRKLENLKGGETKEPEWELFAYPRAKQGKEYTVLKEADSIAPYIFYGNPYIEKVTLNETCDAVSAYMFKDCKALHTIVIESKTKDLNFGERAVDGCESLKNIQFAGTEEAWKKAVSNSTEREMLEKLTPQYIKR